MFIYCICTQYLVGAPFALITASIHRFSMGFRSGESAGQSSTVTPWSLNQLLVPLVVWAGAKSSFSPLLVKLSQVFESALLDSILKLAVIPVACAPFPTQILPSSQLCI